MTRITDYIGLSNVNSESLSDYICLSIRPKNYEVTPLTEYHGENVLILSSPGFENVMGFRSELAKSLHLIKKTDDDLEYCRDRVASVIKIIISKSLCFEKVKRHTT